MSAPSVKVVLVTAPSEVVAVELARAVVTESLAACANLVPSVRSIYRWQGAVQDEAEALLVIKTTDDRLPALQKRLLALHPYQVPEVVVLDVSSGNPAYLSWVVDGTRP